MRLGAVVRTLAAGLPAAWSFLAGPATAAIDVIDDAGARVELAQPATRIVSLAPHLTEQLFAIGAGDRIVGTTDFADYPAAALRIPRVGRAHSVDLERIAQLRPDLVVVWGSGFPPATIDAVRRLGVPVFVSEPRSLADVAASMERLGVLTGSDGTAAAAEFNAKIAALRARYAGRSPVRVFYQVWATPLMTLSGRHVISEAIVLCGGRNVFADLPPLVPQVSVEAVLAADPEIVITAEAGGVPGTALSSWRQFPSLAATRRGQFVTLDADRINRYGPRLADEIGSLCAAIDRTRAGSIK
ncbi:MAG TPA: cobalamin-binding protein [Burkholderiaceae bacterium]|nr:cobalamin-binding protein [Burkholderiaceae bacterium]